MVRDAPLFECSLHSPPLPHSRATSTASAPDRSSPRSRIGTATRSTAYPPAQSNSSQLARSTRSSEADGKRDERNAPIDLHSREIPHAGSSANPRIPLSSPIARYSYRRTADSQPSHRSRDSLAKTLRETPAASGTAPAACSPA